MRLPVKYEELEKEAIEVEYDGAKFLVKPLTADELALISAEYSKRGKIPEKLQGKYVFEILEKVLVGWEGLKDAEGREIPFRREYVRAVLTALAGKGELFEKLLEAALRLVKLLEEEKGK